MGGQHFSLACTLNTNGEGVKLRALADSGANGFVFINKSRAIELAKHFNIPISRLPFTIKVKGFDGETARTPVSHLLRLNLLLNGRKFLNIPLLIIDIASHDLILSRAFFAHFKIDLAVHNRKLIWPESIPPHP